MIEYQDFCVGLTKAIKAYTDPLGPVEIAYVAVVLNPLDHTKTNVVTNVLDGGVLFDVLRQAAHNVAGTIDYEARAAAAYQEQGPKN